MHVSILTPRRRLNPNPTERRDDRRQMRAPETYIHTYIHLCMHICIYTHPASPPKP